MALNDVLDDDAHIALSEAIRIARAPARTIVDYDTLVLGVLVSVLVAAGVFALRQVAAFDDPSASHGRCT